MHQLSRVWVHGVGYEADGDVFPFLFVNGGAATLSASTHGAAILRDTITRREIQLLEHTGTCHLYFLTAFPNPHFSDPRSPCFCYGMSVLILPWNLDVLIVLLSAKAYHISTGMYTIATADGGANATIKIWTARRSPSHLQGRVSGDFGWW